jgi:beta-glucosidase
MCQSEGGRIVRHLVPNAKIGTSFSCSLIHPYRNGLKDLMAAKRMDALVNRMFVEPLAGLGYPVKDFKMLRRLEPFIKDGDESKLAFNMDFIGIQNYTREIVSHAWHIPFLWAKQLKASKRKVETTEMNWEVFPESMYFMLQKFHEYKSFKEIIITENGAAFPDSLINGKIDDSKRIKYLEANILQLLRAKQEGVNVNGYFVWSFFDNFEWAEGFRPRFGLVHIDYKTQKRTIKNSGYWYSKLIQEFLQNKVHNNSLINQ